MFKVTDTSILVNHGFIHYNAGQGELGEYWVKLIHSEEHIMSGTDSSQTCIRIKWDGTVQITYEWEQIIDNGDGDDYGGEVRVPLDPLWELIEAGVIKKVRRQKVSR